MRYTCHSIDSFNIVYVLKWSKIDVLGLDTGVSRLYMLGHIWRHPFSFAQVDHSAIILDRFLDTIFAVGPSFDSLAIILDYSAKVFEWKYYNLIPIFYQCSKFS